MWVLAAVAVVLGLIGGAAAVALFKLISLMTHLTLLGDVGFDLPTLRGYDPSPMIIVYAVGGGLLVSVFALWSPVIRGHGIPESLEAILDRDSRIRPRAAIAKPLSAAITIGTGGPFGAEGPIIVTGGSMGSLIGQLLSVSAAERKIMLATGAAAGMSATFNTPIAAVILAIELVLFERSLRVIVPLSIASAVAAAIHVVAFGSEPLFMVVTELHVSFTHLPWYVLVGVASGLTAIVLNKGLFTMEAAFRRLPINIFWWPAIGALGFAVIGLLVPRTLSMGYSAIVDTLNGRFTVGVLAVLLVAKLASWLIALGSQTSGGTLAPMFLVGATMGALLGQAVNAVFPAAHVSPAAFALVAMGATFGAATKALFAAVVFAAEVTGEYTMLIPLLLGAGVAELVVEAVLSDRLMTEKLSHRGFRVDFRTTVEALRTRVARQVMREPQAVPGEVDLAAAREVLEHFGADRLAVVTDAGIYRGMISLAALDEQADLDPDGARGKCAGDLASAVIEPIEADEYLSTSMERFLRHAVDSLPVVDGGQLVGVLSRDDLLAERYRRGAAQEIRQAGWLAGLRRSETRRAVPAPHSGAASRRDRRGNTWTAGNQSAIGNLGALGNPGAAGSGSNSGAAGGAGGANDTGHSANHTAHGANNAAGSADRAAVPTAGSGAVARRAGDTAPGPDTASSGTSRATRATGQPSHRLLPLPAEMSAQLGRFVLSQRSRIVVAWGSEQAQPIAESLAAELRPATGFRLPVSRGRAYRDDISLTIGGVAGLRAADGAEGYSLQTGIAGITLVAPTVRGLHHGAQTIRQLFPAWISSREPLPGTWATPAMAITDWPRGAERAIALDLSAGEIDWPATLSVIEAAADYKFNTVRIVVPDEHAARPTSFPAYVRIAAHAARRLLTVSAGAHDVIDIDAQPTLQPTVGHDRAAVTVEMLQAAEAGWSHIRGAGVTDADRGVLRRIAAQGPRLALTGTAFTAAPTVSWRVHLIATPGEIHGRQVSGTVGTLVAPGFDEADLMVTVDWGDGLVSPGVVRRNDGDGRGHTGRFAVDATHVYRRGGSYRVVVLAVAHGAVPARASVVMRVGSTGRLRLGGARSAVAGAGRTPESIATPHENTARIESPSA